jgi:protein-S-isoprenylcysteine O-methyltransferase Ste14
MPSWQKVARRIRVPLGFLFAALYVWLARPTWRSIVLGSCVAAVGLFIRALASGHVRKNEQLATTGPYAYTRNPLYLGSMIMALGFTLASRSWIIAATAAVMLIAIYIPVIRGEEEFLRERFPEFKEYCRKVPQLLPRLTNAAGEKGDFHADLYWKHREYNASVGAIALVTILILKKLWLP